MSVASGVGRVVVRVGCVLVMGSVRAVPRRYEVQLAYTGYTGLAESRDCGIAVDPAGYDSLTGTVTGIENPAEPDEDVVYTGTLRRVTRIDYCQTTGGDQARWCKAKLTGAAPMVVELTVYGEDGNGAWLKAKPAASRPDSVNVQGNCPQAEQDAIRLEYPGGESAGSPDGQPIAESESVKFFQGMRRLRVGYFPPNRPETAWGLQVVRVMP